MEHACREVCNFCVIIQRRMVKSMKQQKNYNLWLYLWSMEGDLTWSLSSSVCWLTMITVVQREGQLVPLRSLLIMRLINSWFVDVQMIHSYSKILKIVSTFSTRWSCFTDKCSLLWFNHWGEHPSFFIIRFLKLLWVLTCRKTSISQQNG